MAKAVKTRPNDPCWCGSGMKFKRCHAPEQDPGSLARVATRPVRPGRISPVRYVPREIARPDYIALGGEPGPAPIELVKTPDQIERMRHACRAAAKVLERVGIQVLPGVTTDSLDVVAHDECVRLGGYPSTLGYRGYPKSITTSINEVICHGIPDSRPLAEGDIVNCDVSVFLDGMHGDCSATYLVGDVDPEHRRLVSVTQECLRLGIEQVRPGVAVREIGRAIEQHATAHGFGVVKAFVGHGVGESFHMEPQVPHYYEPQATFELRAGMTFTIEPMITAGTWRHLMWEDGWTAVTADGRRTAQFEHTVLVTPDGGEILTRV
jgi:methionyl aminopeptidase